MAITDQISGAGISIIPAANVSISDSADYFTSTNVEGALQELGSDLQNLAIQAQDVSIDDAGGYYTSTDVEGALQEVGVDLASLLSSGSVRHIANIAALKTHEVTTTQVAVAGYYTAADGGGGLFYGATGASAGTYIDNGGTIIVPTGGDGSSAWIRVAKDVLSVKWFGAKGDGVTNDLSAIQAAINYVGNLGGGGIYVPAGVYIVSGTVNITASNITIIGDNNWASAIVSSSASATVLNISGANSTSFITAIRLEKLRISRSFPHTPTTSRGVSITNTYWVSITDVSSDEHAIGFYLNNANNTNFYRARAVHDVGTGSSGDIAYGFYINSANGLPCASLVMDQCIVIFAGYTGTSYGCLIYGSNVKDSFLDGLETAGVSYGLWIESTSAGGQDAQDIHILRNIHDTYTKEGIVLANLGSSGNVSITDGWVAPSSAIGESNNIRVFNCRGVHISNVQLAGGPNYANNVGVYLNQANTCSVNGCQIKQQQSGVKLNNSGLCTITGNTFLNYTGQTGDKQIHLINSYRNAITANIIDGYSTYGVFIDNSASSNYNTVNGNSINPANIGTKIQNNGGSTNYITGVDNQGSVSGDITVASATVTGSSGLLLTNTNGNITFGASASFGIYNIGTSYLRLNSTSGNYLQLDNTAGAGISVSGVTSSGAISGTSGTFSGVMTVNGYSLTINGSGGLLLQATNSNISFGSSASFGIGNTGTSVWGIYSSSGNYFEITNSAGAGVRATGAYSNISDASLKENVMPVSGALGIVSQLEGVYFNWKENPSLGRQVGLVAQSVKEALPEVVSEFSDDGKLGVAYSSIVAVLINAIKELKAEVDALKAPGA